MDSKENQQADQQEKIQQLIAENEALKKKLQVLGAISSAQGDVLYKMNADWSQMLKLDSPDFLESSSEPIEGWMELYILPADRDAVKGAIQKAIDQKTMFELEHPVILSDGGEGWTLCRAIPLLDDQGNIKEWLGRATDISEAKKAEKEVNNIIGDAERQKRLYETVISNTPDLVYIFDLDARFTYANRALLTMWGRTQEESFGKSLLEVGYEPWHAEMHEREIEHVKKTKESVRGEVAFPHAELGKRVYDYIFVPVLDAEGEVIAIAGTTRDITEISKLSSQKDEFLAIASHELKTPLTSIKAYGQVLQNIFESREDDEAVLLLARMDNQINKLTRLISDLLDVTRIQSGKMQFNHDNFDLSELTSDMLDGLQLNSNKHVIKRALPASLMFHGDKERIGQVITNLVTNAIKYSPAGGAIVVKLEQQQHEVLLSVQDFGLGIPEGMQVKVFEQFYRANNYRQAISGMGIGLFISAEIVERSGGKIWVESTEGKGSTFYVSLPAGNIGND